jgi:hypothetical protein
MMLSGLLHEHIVQRGAHIREAGWLDAIMAAGRTLTHLIEDLLDLSRIEAGRLRLSPSSSDLRALLRELVALFAQAAADKGLRLTFDLDADLPVALWLDGKRLRQILINLIGNALKFTDAGTIRLHAQAGPSGPDRVRLRISIQDSGRGIDESRLAQIFEPFEQLSGSADGQGGAGAGLGLGLSISRRLARLMGGEIAVESRPGEGSCFTLELPEVAVVPLAVEAWVSGEEASPPSSAQPAGAEQATGGPARVPPPDGAHTGWSLPASDAPPPVAVEKLVSRLPADLHQQLLALRPPLASINAIESFIEALSAHAREPGDASLLHEAEVLRQNADAFDLPALSEHLDRLRTAAERTTGLVGSTRR